MVHICCFPEVIPTGEGLVQERVLEGGIYRQYGAS